MVYHSPILQYLLNLSVNIISVLLNEIVQNITTTEKLYVSGYSACHWYINPDIPEAASLLNRYRKNILLSLHIYISTYHIVPYLLTSNSICTLYCCRTHGQSYKIKRSGVPIAEQSQPEPPPVPDFLTLQEMEAIDPYEFPVIYILIYNSSKKYLPPNSIV